MKGNFKQIPKNIKKKSKKLKNAIKFLYRIDQLSKTFEDHHAHEALFCINKILNDEKFISKNTKWKPLLKYNFDIVLVSLWMQLTNMCDSFDFDKLDENSTSSNQIQINIFKHVTDITHTLTKYCLLDEAIYELNKRIFDLDIIKELLSFFKKKKFTHKQSPKFDVHVVMTALISILKNLSENFYHDRQKWVHYKTESILKDFDCKYEEIYSDNLDKILLNINQKSLSEKLDYLRKYDNNMGQLLEDKYVYKDMLIMAKINIKQLKDYKKIFIIYDCDKIFFRILRKVNEMELDFKNVKIEKEYPSNSASLNERMVSILTYMLIVMKNLVFNFVELNIFFSTKEIIKAKHYLLMKCVNNQEIVELLVTNLACFSQNSIDNKKLWSNLSTSDLLFGIIDKFEKNQAITRQCFNCICYILNDKQINESYQRIEGFVEKKLLHDINKIAYLLQHKKYIKKLNIEILNEKTREILKYDLNSLSNNLLLTNLNLLINLSINVNVKKLIYKEVNSIKAIIDKGELIESLYSLKLLAHICLDEDICNDIIENDVKLVNYLNEYYKNLNEDQTDFKNVCQNILFSLKQLNLDTAVVNGTRKTNMATIIFNLNTDNKNIFYQIKDELETNDISLINESSLEKSLKLINHSYCVILLVCEKFRLNEDCSLKTRYASKLDKTIIPLILDSSFKNESFDWLYFVSIRFPLIPFNSITIAEIPVVIQTIVKESNYDFCLTQSELEFISKKEIKLWGPEHVKLWMIHNKFHPILIKIYSKLDGYSLKQLYLIGVCNPQFFHEAIMLETRYLIKLSDLVKFITKLRLLFEH